jgi:hypothetical protein
MRTIEVNDNKAWDKLRGNTKVQSADWKDIDAVFTGFDAQLAEHGLEVVMYETGGDTYIWSVEKKAAAKAKRTSKSRSRQREVALA